MTSEVRSQSLDEQTPPGRERVKFQYISELESTDDRSAMVQILGAGLLGGQRPRACVLLRRQCDTEIWESILNLLGVFWLR